MNTRPPQLTEQQRRELEESGETLATIRKAAWYQPALELAVKLSVAGVLGIVLWTWNRQIDATDGIADGLGKLQQELAGQRGQIDTLVDTMRQLSSRQDMAIATAERAMAEQNNLRARVELLQYYVLEFDGKLIAQGIVTPRESVALKLRKQQEDEKP